MRILILGFGNLAREVGTKIKAFPEYDKNGEVAIYHFFVRRNSLSYGPSLVVEIPDPHGDGYRTYNDGLQAVEKYSTTVSDYEDWLIKEAEEDAFTTIVDCTSETESAEKLVSRLKSVTGDRATYYREESADAVIEKLREELDGGKPWTPVQFSEEFLEDAKIKAEEAAIEMERLHEVRREAMIKTRVDRGETRSVNSFKSFSGVLDPSDVDSIYRFVVNGEGGYTRKETRNSTYHCTIVEHEMLDWFFGPHRILDVGMQLYLDTSIEIKSVRYVKYDSPRSNYMKPKCSKYAEYVINQDSPWPIAIEEQSHDVGVGEIYPGAKNSRRSSLGSSGSTYVELLSFHFGPEECECWENTGSSDLEARAKELRFAQMGEPCGLNSDVDWTKQ